MLNVLIIDDELPIEPNQVIRLRGNKGNAMGQEGWRAPRLAAETLLGYHVSAVLSRGHDLYLIKTPETAVEYFRKQQSVELDAVVLDIMLEPEQMERPPDELCISIMKECLIRQAELHRARVLRIAALTNLNEPAVFARVRSAYSKLRDEYPSICTQDIWIERKAIAATVWAANLEKWLVEKVKNSGF